jgi:hypothetical protein
LDSGSAVVVDTVGDGAPALGADLCPLAGEGELQAVTRRTTNMGFIMRRFC